MLLPIPFLPLLKKPRRRRGRGKPTGHLPSAGVTVVSVTRVDANHALWVFSSAVVGEPENISGLEVGLQAPGGLEEVTAAGALLVEYDDGVFVGSVWSADAAGVIVTFANGGTLSNGAGVVA
jgi:hypothetical protein